MCIIEGISILDHELSYLELVASPNNFPRKICLLEKDNILGLVYAYIYSNTISTQEHKKKNHESAKKTHTTIQKLELWATDNKLTTNTMPVKATITFFSK